MLQNKSHVFVVRLTVPQDRATTILSQAIRRKSLAGYISNWFSENQPNEICSHLSEKASKGRFLKPEKLQNHSNEGKGKEKKKERGEGKKEKKNKQWLHS